MFKTFLNYLGVAHEPRAKHREIWWVIRDGAEVPVLIVRCFTDEIVWILPLRARLHGRRQLFCVPAVTSSTMLLERMRTMHTSQLIRRATRMDRAQFVALSARLQYALEKTSRRVTPAPRPSSRYTYLQGVRVFHSPQVSAV